ncbi:hypothetical protein [Parasitella parasitica]|uniref:Attractin/MKLN-like beta-propeller domain-containing protein n=1 Tax=Parasitella parasitica TaxID=35722 RepID=A0A0B7MWE6_9FUNG|nr:hypothetical protein [Parasitella parasitica]
MPDLSNNINSAFKKYEMRKRNEELLCGGSDDPMSAALGILLAYAYAQTLSLSNLPNSNGSSMNDLAGSWMLVNHSNQEYQLEGRRKAAFTAHNNNTLFISGGYVSNLTDFDNQTIAYNSDTNTWRTLRNYTDKSGGSQQIYAATAISLTPAENTIVMFGGCTEYPFYTGSVDIDSLNNTVMREGFKSIKSFQYDHNQWVDRLQTNTPSRFYAGQTATLNPKTGLIYYMGGYYYTAPDYSVPNVQDYGTGIVQDYRSANVFNSNNGIWQTIELTGIKTPSPRLQPTATMLPNSNHILLFGGSQTGQNVACVKFCYTLDLDTHEWELRTNEALVTADALRFGHSAVLVGTSLFIMFGFTVYGKPLDSILVISVKDVNNLYFAKTFPYAEREFVPVTIASAGLSTGAIAGIGVASGLAVVAAAVVCFLYIRKKKRQAERELEEMPVDWDQVDKFYSNNDASYQQRALNGEAVNITKSKPSHATDALSFTEIAGRYTPNAHDDESTIAAREFGAMNSSSSATHTEEQVKLMKPTMINTENDVKYVSQAPSPLILKMKPDVSVEEADKS